jgi:hypothetical protein
MICASSKESDFVFVLDIQDGIAVDRIVGFEELGAISTDMTKLCFYIAKLSYL